MPWQLRAAGHDPAAFLRMRSAAGYQLASVDPDTGQAHPITEQEVREGVAVAEINRNILALRDDGRSGSLRR
jgi:hypothetical protein